MQPTIYDPNVPKKPSDDLHTSQPQIQNNFQQLFDIFEMNHISLDAMLGAGNHSVIQLYNQKNSPQTNTGELAIYVKEDPITAGPDGTRYQIFVREQGNAPEFQLTCYQLYELQPFGDPVSYTRYLTFLPGRILVYFGQIISLPKPFNLDLFPPIAKSIMTAITCPTGANPAVVAKQPMNPMKDDKGFYSKINMSLPLSLLPIQNLSYIVLANI